jgi:hypothetical protein
VGRGAAQERDESTERSDQPQTGGRVERQWRAAIEDDGRPPAVACREGRGEGRTEGEGPDRYALRPHGLASHVREEQRPLAAKGTGRDARAESSVVLPDRRGRHDTGPSRRRRGFDEKRPFRAGGLAKLSEHRFECVRSRFVGGVMACACQVGRPHAGPFD